jgi:hypothetical protein
MVTRTFFTCSFYSLVCVPLVALLLQVLLEHRHLSLRLRMQLTRVQSLARTAKPNHAFATSASSLRHGSASSTLLARFSRRTAASQHEELQPPPPRRLPDALALEVSQLAALVRVQFSS